MKLFSLRITSLVLVVATLLTVQSCQQIKIENYTPQNAHQFNSDVFHEWNSVFLRIERYAKGYRPGPAPRAVAYMSFAAYETVVPGIPENNSLRSLYAGLNLPELDKNADIYWPAAVNASNKYLMRRFFFHMENEYADLFTSIDQKYKELHDRFARETTEEIMDRSEAWGESVAAAVYEWESADAFGHDAFLNPQPTSYSPPQGPGKWFDLQGARGMFPYWGKVRTFAITEADKLCRPPIPYSENPNSLFYSQAEEVYKTVKFIRENPADGLAYEQKWIAEFWSDDILNETFSPPSRLLAIADQMVVDEKNDLAGAAELYAKLGMAISDNSVSIWNSKYVFNVERPDTYIRRVLKNQYPDAEVWTSILDNPFVNVVGLSPAFPAYPSGHSGFGGAGAKILSSYYEFTSSHPGTYTFTDRCHLGRFEFIGTPRTFTSLSDLGEEDAYSRIPLGVHYRMDCDEGLRLGEIAAQRVLELPWKK
jgi:hypothetical protein